MNFFFAVIKSKVVIKAGIDSLLMLCFMKVLISLTGMLVRYQGVGFILNMLKIISATTFLSQLQNEGRQQKLSKF